MSDNPADSLRRELEAAAAETLKQHRAQLRDEDMPCLCLCGYVSMNGSLADHRQDVVNDVVWPLIAAALEAERERIAQAIEARWPPDHFSHQHLADDATIIRDLAALARSGGEPA